ncbi:MAG: hypothetical protein MJZ51_05925, partial [Bacteroidales bacterium]|nr:hypothetical protein [Bacteroidales bacterium]
QNRHEAKPSNSSRLAALALLRLIWGLSPAYLAVNSDKEPQRNPFRWVQIPRGWRLAIGFCRLAVEYLLFANGQLLTANRSLNLPRRVKGLTTISVLSWTKCAKTLSLRSRAAGEWLFRLRINALLALGRNKTSFASTLASGRGKIY